MIPQPHRLLRASAGTGKTYQLVEAYADLVQSTKLRPSQIVAITFTRKAASELRLRIRAKLHAAGAPPAILAELARAPLANFHGLALQLVSAFGLDAGLHGPIRVLAEADADRTLFAEACVDAWFGGDAATSEAVQIVAPYLKVGDSLPTALWHAISLAREDGASITAQSVHAEPSAPLFEATHARLLALRQRLLGGDGRLTATALQQLERFAASPVPTIADVAALHDTATVESIAVTYAEWSQGWQRMFFCLDRRSKVKVIYSAEDAKWVKEVLPQVEAEALCMALQPAFGTLLEAAWRAYGRLKTERGVVDFVDIIERFNHMMHNRSDLHAALRSRFCAVLVDEAQDTNRLQRHMVDLLCGFAGPAATTEAPARVFVVGDWKQSIYTFRGADPKSFTDFADDLGRRGGEQSTLAVSRRSVAPLVRGINSLGSALFAERYEPLEPLTDGLQQASAASNAVPEPAAGMVWLTLPSCDGRTTAQGLAVEAQLTANWIQSRLATGAEPGDIAILLTAMAPAPLFLNALQAIGIPAQIGGGSGLYAQPEVRDHIALLAWLANPDATLQAATCLRSALFGLSDSALWVLLGPQGRAQNALRALFTNTWNADKARTEALTVLCDDDRIALEEAATHLPYLAAAAQTLGAYELLRAIDTRLHARATYLGLEGGAQRVANIQRLWAIAQAHDRAHGPAVSRFVAQQLQRTHAGFKEGLPAVASTARLAVTISTVHQSKGLQYPIVILPALARRNSSEAAAVYYARDIGFVFRPSRRGVNFANKGWSTAAAIRKDAERDEKRRLLYVAVTRAEREVIFVGPPPAELGNGTFGALIKPWAKASPEPLTVLPAPVGAIAASGAIGPMLAPVLMPMSVSVSGSGAVGPSTIVLDAMPAIPSTNRLRAPGTQFCITMTQLAHDEGKQTLAEPHTPVPLPTPPPPAHPTPTPASASAPVNATPLARQSAFSLFRPGAPLTASVAGELAHGVLAALDERVQHGSHQEFINALLARQGYAANDPRVRKVSVNVEAFLCSPLGQHIASLPAAQRRHEMPFQLAVVQAPYTVFLQGQLDLAYWDAQGPVIVDYKHARAGRDDSAYRRQLDTYAWALSRLCTLTGDIRCYLVYLKERTPPLLHIATTARQTAIQQRLHAYIAQRTHAPLP